jgi:HSP20 family molecular chaperone IbpA|tara:strand:+ start:654 stop:1088 length:435 start_codon:yes stop_codon:yes gene_type:complete
MVNIAERSFFPTDLLFRNFFETDTAFRSFVDTKPNYPVDIRQSSEALRIDIAVVGLDKDDIKIETLDGNTLRVSYEKPSIEANDSNEEAYDYIHRGIARRGFNMGWKIAAKYNLRNIKASMDKGLLSIEIPIHEEEKPKVINIK